MSLLEQFNEDVVVYPEVTAEDSDGNPMTLPSKEGIPAKAMIRPKPQSGTSYRRAEQMDEGFFTEEAYALRFPSWQQFELGSMARIEWRGEYWSIFGEPQRYNGSPRTRRLEYTIVRN